MDVLKHDPMAFFVADIEPVVGNLVLTLSKSDLMELLGNVNTLGSSEVLYLLDWVGTWRQDEVDWCDWG